MLILAIESSCDDCGVAIIKDGTKCLINLVASQEKIHAQYGGVVPEVASREHLRTIYPLVEKALSKTGLAVSDIDALAVTAGPGLLGSLLVGVNAAKTLAWLWKKPVIAVNHLQGHVYSGWLANVEIKFPVVALVVSGGHTEIVLMKKHGDYTYIGGTVDDAMGEAFDKVARFLGLGYPGGPAIANEAMKYQISNSKYQKGSGEGMGKYPITNSKYQNGKGVVLPRPMMDQVNYDFSFSGLKTAVTRAVGKKAEIAYEFQEAGVEVVSTKLFRAACEYGAKTIIIGGGAAANQRLREVVWSKVWPGITIVTPSREYCTDNAAMIGAAAYFLNKLKKGKHNWEKLGLLSV